MSTVFEDLVKTYVERVLRQQDITTPTFHRQRREDYGPIPAIAITSIFLHLATPTAARHLLEVADKGLMLREADRSFQPRELSLGRFFHALGDYLEWQEQGISSYSCVGELQIPEFVAILLESGVSPLRVAAVCHGLADHTHNLVMLQVADGLYPKDFTQGADEDAAHRLAHWFEALAEGVSSSC